ncbi:MAG TPA: hypothetical protein VIH99_12745 [Bdellovibrionota bacterium]
MLPSIKKQEAGKATPKADRDPSEKDFYALYDKLNACELLTRGLAGQVPLNKLWLFFQRKAHFIPAEKEISPDDLLELFFFFEAKDLDKLLRDEPNLSPMMHFFVGLFLADLANPAPAHKTNFNEALRHLRMAEGSQMANAAIPFFRTAILTRSKAGDQKVQAALWDTIRKAEFETYLQRITRMLWSAGLADPKLFVLSLSMINRLPHFNYSPAAGSLSALLTERNRTWLQPSLSFGQLLMRRGLAERERTVNVFWRMDEYDLGRDLARKAWQAMNRNGRIGETEEAWPHSSTFLGVNSLNPFDSKEFPPRERDGKTCDMEGFRRYLGQLARMGG